MDEDFFGVEYISNEPLPDHMLPKSPLSNAIKHSKEERDGSSFIESTFFHDIEKSADQKKDNNNWNKGENEDFFTEHFYERQKNRMKNYQFSNNEEMNDKFVFPQAKNYENGLKILLNLIDPVWKYTREELIEMMINRIVYQTDDLIAFDKPYQLSFASASKDQPQLDRLLTDLKKRVAPSSDRLYLINSLDKNCSGILIFAKNAEKQKKLKKLIFEGYALYRFRTLVKGDLEEPKTRISIPLIKVLKDRDYKLCPLSGKVSGNKTLFHEDTDCQLVNENQQAHITLVDAFSKKGITHVVRSHLYYGLNCPLIGDRKYMKREKEFSSTYAQLPRISDTAFNLLNLRQKNDVRQLPMFFHLAEVHIPESTGGKFSIIRADLPKFFYFALKKLHLGKR